MPLIKLEAELRPIARERIRTGRLPRIHPPRVWGGHGAGRSCALCDQVIHASEKEFEVESTDLRFPDPLHFHVVCHSIWQLECARADHLKRNP